MTQPLWAPWRLEYIKQADEQPGCVFCLAQERSDEDGLIVHRGERAFVLLNKFPYSSGHVMVAPNRHVGEFGELENDEAVEIHRLAAQALGALAAVYEPQGYNLGWNLGRIAGAGVVDHVHQHVVPRWGGDINFMHVVGEHAGADGLSLSGRGLAALSQQSRRAGGLIPKRSLASREASEGEGQNPPAWRSSTSGSRSSTPRRRCQAAKRA